MSNETEESKAWLSAAIEPSVVRRALGYAIAVGAILILINHGDAVFTGNINGSELAQMGLTVIVPYFVSTLSIGGATRARREEKDKSR